jgi:HD-like signal output (HDOD) protein
MSENIIPIDKLLDQVGNLPPMPRVVEKALQIIQDPNSNMKDLASVIKLDQAMTSLILRWVNSGYYSLRNKMVTIEQAVAYLGQRTVQNLVLSASVASFMNRPSPGYGLGKGDLWKRSIGMAAGARLIMKEVAPEKAEDAYYAGLFCDIGKLVFDVLVQRIPLSEEPLDKSFDEIETNMFGYDHAVVGAAIVRRWNLPPHLARVVECHHTPSHIEEPLKLLAYSVHAADAVMMMFGIGMGIDAMQYNLDPMTVEVLKWDDSSLESFYERVMPLIQEADSFLQN